MTIGRRASREPTIEDVARLAGVSTATASRVLGQYGNASRATKAKVTSAAHKLGYRPNALARSMITGATHTIGLVVPDIENPFFARAARGVADVARNGGFELIVTNIDEDFERERAAVRVMMQKRVDGLVVAPAARTGETAPHLADVVERGTPIVLLDRGVRDVRTDTIIIDNRAASHAAINHLVRLGHRRIAIITEADAAVPDLRFDGWRSFVDDIKSRPQDHPTSSGRLAGYLEALDAAGLPVESDLIRFAEYDRESAAAQTEAVLRDGAKPTAIFTTDNLMTIGALTSIQGIGVEVPRDLSVVGFDDLDWTTIVVPALTVIAQPVTEMGATAARLLLERIAGLEADPRIVALDTKLIERSSTGAAPAAD